MIIYKKEEIRLSASEQTEMELVKEAYDFGARVIRYKPDNFELWESYTSSIKEGYIGKIEGSTFNILKNILKNEIDNGTIVFELKDIFDRIVEKDKLNEYMKKKDALSILFESKMAQGASAISIYNETSTVQLYAGYIKYSLKEEDRKIVYDAFKQKFRVDHEIIKMSIDDAIAYLQNNSN